MGLFGKKEANPKKRQKKTAKKVPEKIENPGKLSEKQIAVRVAEGELHVIITFELVGKPKAHIEKALEAYIKNLQKDGRITTLQLDTAEAIKLEDGMFSTYAEMDCLIKGLDTLVWIAVNFSPASIEIMEPEEYALKNHDLTKWLNDIISKLHEISAIVLDSKSKTKTMTAALNGLITNFLLELLKRPMTPDELQKRMGIHKDQLKQFLDHHVEKGRVVKKGKKYQLKKAK